MGYSSSSDQHPGLRFYFADFLIFFIALAFRLIHIWLIADNPFFASPILDAEVYDQKAWQIAQGNWIGDEAFFQAPLYSYFLAVIYAIFGHNYLIPRLIQVLLGSLSAWMVYRLGRRVYDPSIAFIAALIFALYGPLIHFSGQFLIPILFIFLLLIFLLQLDRLIDRPSPGNFLLSGLLLGLTALARPNILIFLPIALFWIAFRLKDRGRGIVLFAAGALLVILPVTIRNYAVTGDFVLISSQGGVNFYMGNNPWSTGHSAWVPGTPRDWWAEGYPATIKIAERDTGKPLKASQVSAYWWKKALTEMSSRPLQWTQLLSRKIHYLLAGHEISNTEDIYYQREFSALLAVLMWEKGIAFPFGLILPLAFLGLALSFRWRRQSHLILFQASYAISIILFFVTARYRLPLVPIFCLWAAAGLVVPFRLARQGQIGKYAITGLAFIILLILVNRNPLRGSEIPCVDGSINMGNKHLENKQYEKAIAAFREAAILDSQSARSANGAGVALLGLGRIDEAKREFERAILLEPALLQAHNNLARICQQEGDLMTARSHFAKVMELDSSNVFAQRGFADVALTLKEYTLAQQHYEKAHDLGASDRQLISRWAQTLLMQEKYAEALRVNAILLASEPGNARARHNQARIYMACDSLDQAERELEEVLRLTPDSKEARNQLEEIRKIRGNP